MVSVSVFLPIRVLHHSQIYPFQSLVCFFTEIASLFQITNSAPGIGLFFSVFMIGLTALQARYTAFSPRNSEEFTSASRSIKPGLIASGIVSAWTWAATLVGPSSFRLTRVVTDVGLPSCKVVQLRINLVRLLFRMSLSILTNLFSA